MDRKEYETFSRLLAENLPEALAEAGGVDLGRFPRVRIVFEFEAPDKFAIEVRKRRPWSEAPSRDEEADESE